MLLSRNLTSKIGDVGLSRLAPSLAPGAGASTVMDTRLVGTPAFMDPGGAHRAPWHLACADRPATTPLRTLPRPLAPFPPNPCPSCLRHLPKLLPLPPSESPARPLPL